MKKSRKSGKWSILNKKIPKIKLFCSQNLGLKKIRGASRLKLGREAVYVSLIFGVSQFEGVQRLLTECSEV